MMFIISYSCNFKSPRKSINPSNLLFHIIPIWFGFIYFIAFGGCCGSGQTNLLFKCLLHKANSSSYVYCSTTIIIIMSCNNADLQKEMAKAMPKFLVDTHSSVL